MEASTMFYLYLKTHNKTGLKYLGKTNKDPHVYRGSGVRWTNHINKHGYDVTTEILAECDTNEEIALIGGYYSDLWNIVESEEFANLKPETGDGGSYQHRQETKEKLSRIKKGLAAHNKGKLWSQERKDKKSESQKGEKNPMYGKVVVNNGITNLTIDKNEGIPDGYVKGALQKIGNKKGRPGISNPNFGKMWITNGEINKMINKADPMPIGWHKGRI